MITICSVPFIFLLAQFSLVIIRVCFLTSSDSYQNKRDKNTRYWLSARAKTSHSLRGKCTQIILIEITVDKYQHYDPWPNSHSNIKTQVLLTILFEIFIIVWILRYALRLRSFILDSEIFIVNSKIFIVVLTLNSSTTLRQSYTSFLYYWYCNRSGITKSSYLLFLRNLREASELLTAMIPKLQILMTVVKVWAYHYNPS